MPVNERKPLTAFGEVMVAEPSPRVQLDATYGLRATDVIQWTENGGGITTENTGTGFEFKVSTGTNAAGHARMQSRKIVRYKTGQGSLFRFTGRFSEPTENSSQRVGCGNRGTHFGFGYHGKVFGIFYHNGGFCEIQTLTISAGAAVNGTATVTLNGVAKNVAITAGTAKKLAFELGKETYPGWKAYHNGVTVIFVADRSGPKTGAFAFSTTGTGAGTFAQTRAGVAETERFIPQSEWNIDRMDGSALAGIQIDPLKGNVFEIQLQYLGYGALLFCVENPGHGTFQKVHRIEYPNANVSPNMTAPYLHLEMEVENQGNTTNVDVYSASMAGFTEGIQVPLRDLRGFGNTKTGIGTSFTNIVSFRCSRTFADRINRSPMWPHIVAFAAEATKPVECIGVINPVVAGEPDWTYIDAADSIVEYDTAGTTVTGGRRVVQFSLGKSDGVQVNLPNHYGHVYIGPGEVFCLAARATAVTADLSASCSWEEE
jgi:hypothetical protein